MSNKLSIDDIERFFGIGQITLEEARELQQSANADSHEGVEWLPYYKMALARLAECCGRLRALVDEKHLPSQDYETHMAGRAYHQHLLLCGIGPKMAEYAGEDNAEAVRAAIKIAADGLAAFMKRT